MGGKVLIVFDSQQQRRAANLLEGGGYPFKVGHLERADLVIAAIERIKPDIIIIYSEDYSARMYSLCSSIRNTIPNFSGILAIYSQLVSSKERDCAIDAGADTLINDSGSSLVVRISSLLDSVSVSREYLRRSHSLARASAEAADIIVRLEEAGRRIQEQNDQLRARDEQILLQQEQITKHLEQIRHELQLAASLQINLMPSGKHICSGYPIAITDHYVPAEDLGGDYYDYVVMPDGGLFICVADVTGHGVAPALVTVQLRALARNHLCNGQPLAAVLSDLNAFMYETFHQEYLMTMAAAVYHPDSSEIEFVGAGHCPVMHYKAAENECMERFSTGVPLGVVADADYEVCKFEYSAGDKLFFYTDGITEASNEQDEEYSPERLLETFTRLAAANQGRVIDSLLESVSDFAGGSQFSDDVTMVLLEL